METKGITCKIPKELHDRISEEIRSQGITVSKFIEAIINEHYAPKEGIIMKQRTMAFQISEELFQKIKDYLARYEQVYGRRLTQREFVLGLIESALEEADEEFEAAEAARHEDEVAEPVEAEEAETEIPEAHELAAAGEPEISDEPAEDIPADPGNTDPEEDEYTAE